MFDNLPRIFAGARICDPQQPRYAKTLRAAIAPAQCGFGFFTNFARRSASYFRELSNSSFRLSRSEVEFRLRPETLHVHVGQRQRGSGSVFAQVVRVFQQQRPVLPEFPRSYDIELLAEIAFT